MLCNKWALKSFKEKKNKRKNRRGEVKDRNKGSSRVVSLYVIYYSVMKDYIFGRRTSLITVIFVGIIRREHLSK